MVRTRWQTPYRTRSGRSSGATAHFPVCQLQNADGDLRKRRKAQMSPGHIVTSGRCPRSCHLSLPGPGMVQVNAAAWPISPRASISGVRAVAFRYLYFGRKTFF